MELGGKQHVVVVVCACHMLCAAGRVHHLLLVVQVKQC